MNDNNTIALIDADILLYKFCFRNQETIDWGDGVVTNIVGEAEEAFKELVEFAEDIKSEVKADTLIYCLSDSTNFRFDILPSYKGNRKKTEPPALKQELKQCIINNKKYEVKIKSGLEADDTMGILITLNPSKYICCSIDKDLRTVAGQHFNWNKEEEGIVNVSIEEANNFFYEQILTGDATDGYSGVPGIGKAKAKKILDKAYSNYNNYLTFYNGSAAPLSLELFVWGMIKHIYEEHSLTEEYALKQARMARILRSCDYNFSKEKPILWSPK